jgi:hypothetical protein
MNKEGIKGAKTIFDVPLSYIHPEGREELIRNFL